MACDLDTKKKLCLKQRYIFREGKNAFEGDLQKNQIGIEAERGVEKETWGWRLAWSGSTKKEASHLLGLRGRHHYPDQRSGRIRASCVASTAVRSEAEEDQMAELSV